VKTFLSWVELTGLQKEAALVHTVNQLLNDVVQGAITFGPEIQAQIDAAFAKADRTQTPWFAGEHVMEACGDLLRQVAQTEAESALYLNPNRERDVSTCVLPYV
jgi:hypothetical protein